MTKTASTLEQFDLVQFWCELALRPLFRCTAIRGIDRFFRKLLLCGMRRNELHIHDYETDVVPSFCGDDVSLTHYLSFKAASLSWDRELGCKSLRKLASTTDVHRGQELLYASLSRVGLGPDRELILSILQYLLESCYGPGAETVNLPLLLRCTIRVLRMAEQDESEEIRGMSDANLASHTCSLFEMGKTCPNAQILMRLHRLKVSKLQNNSQPQNTPFMMQQMPRPTGGSPSKNSIGSTVIHTIWAFLEALIGNLISQSVFLTPVLPLQHAIPPTSLCRKPKLPSSLSPLCDATLSFQLLSSNKPELMMMLPAVSSTIEC